jgi:DNA-binding protein HU-beta
VWGVIPGKFPREGGAVSAGIARIEGAIEEKCRENTGKAADLRTLGLRPNSVRAGQDRSISEKTREKSPIFSSTGRGSGNVLTNMATLMTKSQLLQAISAQHDDKFTRSDIKKVLETLQTIGHKELKKNGSFVIPGFVKLVLVKKPATKARKGINPFTKEPTVFKAKPARKVVKARPVKAIKDAIA